MARIDQVNELLKNELANLLVREMPMQDAMVTISYVDCSPNLKDATIGISVLPEKYFGTTLKKLRQLSRQLSNSLRKRTNLKMIPKFNWVIDKTEKDAGELEDLLEKISRGEI